MAAAASVVTPAGVGDLRIGTPISQLRRMGIVVTEQSEDGSDCSYWSVPGRKGLSLMVSRNRVVRIDIDSPAYHTSSGARVGMKEAKVLRIYGSALKVEPHPYTGPQGHYLVLRTPNQPYGIIFETDYRPPHKVESFRVGFWSSVQLIEGCS
jgi:hypothetical protein